MANAFKHTRHFRLKVPSVSSYPASPQNESATIGNETFSNVSDARTKIAFTSVWNTGAPSITYALADSDTTLKVTYEFDDLTKQNEHKAAIDALLAAKNDTGMYTPTSPKFVEHFKTEWYHENGDVSATTNLATWSKS